MITLVAFLNSTTNNNGSDITVSIQRPGKSKIYHHPSRASAGRIGEWVQKKHWDPAYIVTVLPFVAGIGWIAWVTKKEPE